MAELGRMHEAIEDLTGLPTGNHTHLVLAHEEGTHGALWAYPWGGPGHHIGVPGRSWPNLVAAANRRPMISALVHELGHVAFWWDRDDKIGRHYLLWGGAVEGSATPTGAYACVKYRRVPAWIDFPGGGRDWARLEDFVNDILRGGVDLRKKGVLGQDSVDAYGHGPGASIVESTFWDLFFRVLGNYDAYRTTLRHYVQNLCTPAQAAKSDAEKVTDFFTLLGRAAKLDLSPYLAHWGYDVEQIRARCFDLPACDAKLPDPPAPRYGAVEEPGWA